MKDKGPPPGNQNAAKPPDEHLSSRVILACHPVEKSSWIQASFPGKLSEWIREKLNAAASASNPILADKLADILVKRSDSKQE
jgi:hypothetical protein